MRILYFTNPDITDFHQVTDIIKSYGDEVIVCTKKFNLEYIIDQRIEFIVSDRSRALITKDIINFLPKKIINLHPSFLPFGKGYHPNYWSIVEGTKKGVTIHYIDEGIDTGDIIIQTEFFLREDDTLRGSYNLLRHFMVELFRASWPKIRDGSISSMKQETAYGSMHMKKDFEGRFEKLRLGWDTPIRELPSSIKRRAHELKK